MVRRYKINVKENSAIAISQYLMENYEIEDPIKLQKILFFLTLESLKQRDCLLFTEPFEAWLYGPVVPEVYYFHHSRFPQSTSNTLSFIKKLNDPQVQTFIDLNVPKYLRLSAVELRDWAHQTTPWILARSGYKNHQRGHRKLKNSALRAFARSEQFAQAWENHGKV